MFVDLSTKEEFAETTHKLFIDAFLLSALPVVRGIVRVDGKIVVVVLLKFDFACHRLDWGDIRAHCLRVIGGTHDLRITYRLVELVDEKVAVLQPIRGLAVTFFSSTIMLV